VGTFIFPGVGTAVGGFVGAGLGGLGGAIWGGFAGSGQKGFRKGTRPAVVPGLVCGLGGGILGPTAIAAGTALGGGTVAAGGAAAGGAQQLVRPGGLLSQVLQGMQDAFQANPPCNAEQGLDLVRQVTNQLNIQPGIITNMPQYLSGGPAILQNVGGVITTVSQNGSIVVEKGGQIILRLTR
jgi:hypothetical protein